MLEDQSNVKFVRCRKLPSRNARRSAGMAPSKRTGVPSLAKGDASRRQAIALDRSIGAYIEDPDPAPAGFERLALELFAYQYDNNEPYRALCDQLGRTPAHVSTWRDVPALTAASFADARIACFPADRTALTFVSSGTTRSAASPSTHELENAVLYDASLLTHFRASVMPDRGAMIMVMLSPPAESAPQSSLAYMLSKIFTVFGRGGGFFIDDDALDVLSIDRTLREASEPVLVFGTAFAFVHLLDAWSAAGVAHRLPAGSRIVETGGFKGRSRTVEREELYGALGATFGVPREYCISEYGMCELGSQWYDASLADALAGRAPREGLKIGPHWARTRVVDPVTARELPLGTPGLLQCFDLSNRGSVSAVLTGDLATQTEDGFRYLGRSPAAPPKGCSITVDAMLRSRA